jgi:cell shape-determining protein MreC
MHVGESQSQEQQQKLQLLQMIEREIRNLYTNCSHYRRSLGKNDRSTPQNLVCTVVLGYVAFYFEMRLF